MLWAEATSSHIAAGRFTVPRTVPTTNQNPGPNSLNCSSDSWLYALRPVPMLAVVGNEAPWVASLLLLAAVGALQTSRVGDVLRHPDARWEDEARSRAHMRGSAR